MKNSKLIIISILILMSGALFAQKTNFGLGMIAGSPTGISAKYWVSGSKAVDFGLGYSFARNDAHFNFHADYLWHESDVFHSNQKLLFFYGIGFRLKTSDNGNNSLGVRGAFGISWFTARTPLEFFFELAPVVKIIPETALDVDGGLGARFYF